MAKLIYLPKYGFGENYSKNNTAMFGFCCFLCVTKFVNGLVLTVKLMLGMVS